MKKDTIATPKKPVLWKRIIPSGLLCLGILSYFWSTSRYPALIDKAGMSMGGRIQLESLGFDQVLFAGPDSTLFWQVFATFVNWTYTNKNGMLFGLVFAAAFLTFLRYLTLGRSRYRLINTLKGILIGTPMGVCANCVAPIGQGMYAAGERIETVLASMVSSPTLNVVVLSLMIGLFPIELAITKILLTIIVLIIVIPLISVYIDRAGRQHQQCTINPVSVDNNAGNVDESWLQAVAIIVKQFFGNLIYILRKTLPLMILAGMLGSVVIEIFPMENFTALQVGFVTILVVSLLGTFLPVPITFDVIIASTLMQAGLPPAFAMILLFTLGAYSIYPMSIIWQSMSRFAALALFVTISGLGMASGFAIDLLEKDREKQILATYEKYGSVHSVEATDADEPGDWASLIRSGCARFPGPELVARCNIVSTIFLAQEARSSQLCDSLPVAGQRLMCHHETLGAVYADTLPAPGLEKKCKELVRGTQAVDGCLLQIAEQYGRDDLCGLLSSDVARQSCRQKVTMSKFAESGNLDACKQLPGEREVNACRESVVFAQASLSFNTGLCQQLDNLASIKDCKTVTLLRQMMSGARDPGICQQISKLGNKQLVVECGLYIAAAEAIATGEPEQCAALQDPRVQGICYQQMLSMIKFFIEQLRTPLDTSSLMASLSEEAALGSRERKPASQTTIVDMDSILSSVPVIESTTVLVDGSIKLRRFPHRNRVAKGKLPFLRLEGSDVGIMQTELFSPLDFNEPFVYGRGIASGDFNNDNWPDILLATNRGVRLFQNLGNGKFTQIPVQNRILQDLDVFAVALVDIDNDGMLDIFASSYGGKNVVLINDGNRFQSSGKVLTMPQQNRQRLLTMAAAFGDLDRDGDLDVMLGNWSFGAVAEYNPVFSKNELFLNQQNRFEMAPLDDIPGETLSILMSDIDHDQTLDLLIANDGPAPDVFYREINGSFEMSKYGDNAIPVTPWYSMSYDSGDINNDLKFDIFATDMSFSRSLNTDYCGFIKNKKARGNCEQGLVLKEIHQNYEISKCSSFNNPDQRSQCRTAILIHLAVQKMRPELCSRIPDEFASKRRFCEMRANLKNTEDLRTQVSEEYIPQVQKNVLLVSGAGGFQNQAEVMGVDASFWSWNSKFVDLNNDGWLDIYIGNGYLFNPQEIHSNIFFLNQQGKGFKARQKEYGLEDMIHTSSWTSLDIDFDGDLDLVTSGIMAPIRIWINNDKEHNSIRFAFRDNRGNRFGIGNKVTIYYGNKGQQIREIKASGGFLSFDEPVLHFGLGQEEQVERVVIDWSTGEKTEINTPLSANASYLIERSQ